MTQHDATQPNDNNRVNDVNDNEKLTEAKSSEEKGAGDLIRQQSHSHGLKHMHLKHMHPVGTSTPHPIPKK